MIDFDDPSSIERYAQPALEAAATAQVAASRLAVSPARGLVEVLEQLLQALRATDPPRLRRSVGLLGRVTGADIELEARGHQLRKRLGVLLADAEKQAERLQAHAAVLALAENELVGAVDGLATAVDQGRHWLDRPHAVEARADHHAARTRFERRLATLARATEAYRMSALQLRLAREQAHELHERYTRIRDVLLPVWRQRALAEAGLASSERTGPATAPDSLEHELAAMRGRLR